MNDLFPPADAASDADRNRAAWIVAKAQTDPADLTAWERRFIDGIARTLARYGNRLRLSRRQQDVLEAIDGRVG